MVATILGFLALEGIDPTAGTAETSAWRFIVPAIAASSAVFPVVMLDMLIFTNRFTGPLRRFRKHLQCLAEGRQVSTLNFRPGDVLTDLSYHVNEIHTALTLTENDESAHDNSFDERIPQTMGADC